MKPVDLPIEDLVNLLNVVFETYALADLNQIVAPNSRVELRIVQQ